MIYTVFMGKTYHHGDLKSSAINKALELIIKRNDVDFTLREISKFLEVSHTALYRHFPSKVFLLIAIAEEGFAELNEHFLKILDQKTGKKNRLNEICTEYIMFAFEKPGHFRSMFHQELRCGADLPESFIKESDKGFDLISEAIQTSQPAHLKKVDLYTATRTVWASIHGFALLLIDGNFVTIKNKSDLKEAIQTHLKLISI